MYGLVEAGETLPLPETILTNVTPLPHGGSFGTVPELVFEKKGLIPALQQLLVAYSKLEGECFV